MAINFRWDITSVIWYKIVADISEDHSDSIFRIMNIILQNVRKILPDCMSPHPGSK
jgi:hypothetical protein